MNAVKTSLDFLADSSLYQSEKPFVVLRDVEHQRTHSTAQLTNVKWDVQRVLVNDMRSETQDLALETAGFQMIDHASSNLQFSDIPSIVQYRRETERLLTEFLEANFVVCYDCKVILKKSNQFNTRALNCPQLRKNAKIETAAVDINDPLTIETPPKGLHGKYTTMDERVNLT